MFGTGIIKLSPEEKERLLQLERKSRETEREFKRRYESVKIGEYRDRNGRKQSICILVKKD